MKKLITIALVVVMAFALFVGAKTAYAALLSYDSSIQVQNLEATPASITISFYNRDGTLSPVRDGYRGCQQLEHILPTAKYRQ